MRLPEQALEARLKLLLKSEHNNSYPLLLERTKNAMVFGSSGYFTNMEYELVEDMAWPVVEVWYARDEYSTLYFKEGKFLYSEIGSTGITSISADCDKF